MSYNFLTCSEICLFLNMSSGTPTFVTVETIGLLSFIRYYLAWKMANNEGFRPYNLVALVAFVYFTEHFCLNVMNYLVTIYFNIPTLGIGACAGKSMEGGSPAMPIFHAIRGCIFLFFGMRYDSINFKL